MGGSERNRMERRAAEGEGPVREAYLPGWPDPE